MPLAPITRVLFEHNPLAEVISQVRFPAILGIEASLPVQFQESVRTLLPTFEEQQISVASFGLPDEVQRIVRSLPHSPSSKQYVFGSADGMWSLTLSRDALSLGCKEYRRWEEFRDLFIKALGEFEKLYRPAFYSRVGLRYRNVILRSKLGLSDTPWAKLLKTHIASELGAPDLDTNEIDLDVHQFILKLPAENGRVRVQHGIGQLVASAEGQAAENVYVIDNDFYTEPQTEIPNAPRILDYFNSQSGRLFRWCITPELEQAMGPRRLD